MATTNVKPTDLKPESSAAAKPPPAPSSKTATTAAPVAKPGTGITNVAAQEPGVPAAQAQALQVLPASGEAGTSAQGAAWAAYQNAAAGGSFESLAHAQQLATAGAQDFGVTFISAAEAQQTAGKLGAEFAAQSSAFAKMLGKTGASAVNSPEVQNSWGSFVAGVASEVPMTPPDVHGLVQSVLRESYMQQTEDLYYYAQRVRSYNEQKKEIRAQLDEKRKELSDLPRADPNLPADQKEAFETERAAAAEKITDEITKLEEDLNTVGDDAQLANIDLQNALQKQQQTIQTMSNISKMLHDTAMAIIRKIG